MGSRPKSKKEDKEEWVKIILDEGVTINNQGTGTASSNLLGSKSLSCCFILVTAGKCANRDIKEKENSAAQKQETLLQTGAG